MTITLSLKVKLQMSQLLGVLLDITRLGGHGVWDTHNQMLIKSRAKTIILALLLDPKGLTTCNIYWKNLGD